MKRELYKEVELGGRRWRIGRFDALTGSYISTLIVMQLLPFGVGELAGLGSISSGKSLMSKETFIEVQKDCLKVVCELKLVGESVMPLPVMFPDGRWGAADLEDNAPIVMGLTAQVLMFNILDFFPEGVLKDLSGMFQDLSQSKSKE